MNPYPMKRRGCASLCAGPAADPGRNGLRVGGAGEIGLQATRWAPVTGPGSGANPPREVDLLPRG